MSSCEISLNLLVFGWYIFYESHFIVTDEGFQSCLYASENTVEQNPMLGIMRKNYADNCYANVSDHDDFTPSTE